MTNTIINSDNSVLKSVKLGKNTYCISVNQSAEREKYSVYTQTDDGVFVFYYKTEYYETYLDALDEWNRRITLAVITQKGKVTNNDVLTCDDVKKVNSSDDLTNKVIAIKTSSLAREQRFITNQLVIVKGGLGARANARGRTIICKNLATGKNYRYDRLNDVLGIVKEEKLSDWIQRR